MTLSGDRRARVSASKGFSDVCGKSGESTVGSAEQTATRKKAPALSSGRDRDGVSLSLLGRREKCLEVGAEEYFSKELFLYRKA